MKWVSKVQIGELCDTNRPDMELQAWFYIGRILAVWERTDKEIYSDDFTGWHIDILHRRTRPVQLHTFLGLVAQMVRQPVVNRVFGISFIELRLSHRKLAVSFTAIGIFFIKQFERYAWLFSSS